jgi:hypothetical protein
MKPHIVLRLRMSGAIPLPHLQASETWRGQVYPFYFFYIMEPHGKWRYSPKHSLMLALDMGEWSTSCPNHLTPGKRAPTTHWTKVRADPWINLDTAHNTEITLFLHGSKFLFLSSRSPGPGSSHYRHSATLVPNCSTNINHLNLRDDHTHTHTHTTCYNIKRLCILSHTVLIWLTPDVKYVPTQHLLIGLCNGHGLCLGDTN